MQLGGKAGQQLLKKSKGSLVRFPLWENLKKFRNWFDVNVLDFNLGFFGPYDYFGYFLLGQIFFAISPNMLSSFNTYSVVGF